MHKHDVKMLKAQVEPRAAGESFHCKVLNIQASCSGCLSGWYNDTPTFRRAAVMDSPHEGHG